LAGLLVLWAGQIYCMAQETQVAVAEKPAIASGLDGRSLRIEGIDSALAGQFAKGLDQLRSAVKADPADAVAAEAVKLIEEHMKVAEKSNARRSAEYEDCVTRVAHMKIAQDFVTSADKDLLKQLSKIVREMGKAYNENSLADTLEDSLDANGVDTIRKQSIDALGRAVKSLNEAVKLLEKDDGDYAKTFREIAGTGRKLMEKHVAGWKAVKTDKDKAWRGASQDLREIEYDEVDVLGDLESMTYEKPWRIGLIQARLARRLAMDMDKFVHEGWLTDLVKATEARGQLCVKSAEWYDALSCYAALEDLLPDDTNYSKTVKTVTRHVHVLMMYGGNKAATQLAGGFTVEPRIVAVKPAVEVPPGDEDSTDAGEADQPDWREMVAHVDADMVEKVIGQLDLNYVSAVDYRQVTKGGLNSVKVLAETPQAGNSFALLKDDAKRKAFLAAIDRQVRDVETRDRVTHLDLILALNSVLHASEQTVDIPTDVLCVEFTDGFLDELDKFSSMIWPSDVSNFEKQTMGHFYGIGVQIYKDAGEPLKVVTPLAGTPAFEAGIQAGDMIVKVDGKPTEKMSIDKLIKLIMGDKGTTVELTIRRGGSEKVYRIVRDEIQIQTVKGWRCLPKNGQWDYLVDPESKIAYVRVTQFTNDTDDRIGEVLAKCRKDGVASVIMDLRFNPGGLLRSARDVSNEFLRSGRIVSTRGRHTRPTDLNAGPDGNFLDGDLIVLINQYSASAAEIVSGALQDWTRARIVGQRTYGKGSVQNVISLSSHSALLKLTTAHYYLPKGRLLHRTPGAKDWGVDPDVEVFLSPRETRRWLDIRRKTDILHDGEQAQLSGDLARQYEVDTQLSTAVLMLKLSKLRAKGAA
jgi:carboxyl-terminal processing protease